MWCVFLSAFSRCLHFSATTRLSFPNMLTNNKPLSRVISLIKCTFCLFTRLKYICREYSACIHLLPLRVNPFRLDRNKPSWFPIGSRALQNLIVVIQQQQPMKQKQMLSKASQKLFSVYRHWRKKHAK